MINHFVGFVLHTTYGIRQIAWSIDNVSPHSFWSTYVDANNALIGQCFQKDNGSYLMVYYDHYEKKLLPGKHNQILIFFNHSIPKSLFHAISGQRSHIHVGQALDFGYVKLGLHGQNVSSGPLRSPQVPSGSLGFSITYFRLAIHLVIAFSLEAR